MTALQAKCAGPRLSVEPLLEAISTTDITSGGQLRSGCSHLRQAELLGVVSAQLYRWKRYGLTWVQADSLAVRIGEHPSNVWGRDWWAIVDEVDL